MKMMTPEEITEQCPRLKRNIERARLMQYWGEYLCGERASPESDIDTRALFITIFKDEKANQKFRGEHSLTSWADHILTTNAKTKADTPWLKLAKFGNLKTKNNCLRHGANVQEITGIEVDYDGEQISFEQARDRIRDAGIRALLYTSASHTKEKPRWRILVPLSKDYPPASRAPMVGRINGLFNGSLAPESFVLSTSYHYGSVRGNPHHQATVVDGGFLDLNDRLHAGSIDQYGHRVDHKDFEQNKSKPERSREPGNTFSEYNPNPADKDEIITALAVIGPDCGWRLWYKLASAIWYELRDDGEDVFHHFSARSAKYSKTQCDKKWSEAVGNTDHKAGTIFYHATLASPDWRERFDDAYKPTDIDWSKVECDAGWLKSVADLQDDFSPLGKKIVAHVGGLNDLNFDLTQARLIVSERLSNWSDVSTRLVKLFLQDGRITVEKTIAALMCDLKCNEHVTSSTDSKVAAERVLRRAQVEIAKEKQTNTNSKGDRGFGDNSGVTKTVLHTTLASHFLDSQQARGEDLRVVADKNGEESLWRCNRNQLWELVAFANTKIDGEIEVIARSLGIITTDKMVSETRNYILRSPEVRPTKDKIRIEFDMHGKIAVRGQLIEPRTMKVEPLTKEHYATQTLDVDYDENAECPWWLKGLDAAFTDRSGDVKAGTISLIQEMAGMTLVLKKEKALSKALIFFGKSNSGKTTLAETIARMSSDHPIATSLEAISGPHGLQEFAYSNAPWLLHEAFGKTWVPGEKIKAIISGDWIGINIKNGPLLTKRILNPIIWCTNAPVQISEASSAVRNRIVIVDCRMEFKEDQLVGLGAEAKRLNFENPHDYLLEHEKAGIFNWMLEGMKRALARGHFINTDEGETKLNDFRTDSNRVASFLEECVSFGPTHRIRVADFCAAFALHWEENKDSKRGAPANDTVSRDLIEMGDACIGVSTKELRDTTHRFYIGMHLNKIGFAYWNAAVMSDRFTGRAKPVRTSNAECEVNRVIPKSWDDKPTVKRVKAADFTAHDKQEDVADTAEPDQKFAKTKF
jgi:hypothetical protein